VLSALCPHQIPRSLVTLNDLYSLVIYVALRAVIASPGIGVFSSVCGSAATDGETGQDDQEGFPEDDHQDDIGGDRPSRVRQQHSAHSEVHGDGQGASYAKAYGPAVVSTYRDFVCGRGCHATGPLLGATPGASG
jgi:hypothetical protein